MQFHHYGYAPGDPRISPVSVTGATHSSELPNELDVLVVGSGPAGMILAAQLAQFPGIATRIIERRPSQLTIGRADGIQARSVETFQAFGFAERIIAEAYRITAMHFWAPDPADRSRIARTARIGDDITGVSEFPHLVVNQARVLDYFGEVMATSPSRMVPDYGIEFVDLNITDNEQYPVAVTLRSTGHHSWTERVIGAKYVVGCDGARSRVREAIGLSLMGTQAQQAWAVVDVLAVTDFPDIRMKCAIQSQNGSALLIPREGGYLLRMYVDLGENTVTGGGSIRATSAESAIAKANAILHPYSIDVKDVVWFSVYEVGHRLAERFDDVPAGCNRTPRVFIAGDACHTHSAKAGQGMNVSMQDGFNLGWKLASVLDGRSPESLLATYSDERHLVAQSLIEFDKEWSSLMAKKMSVFDSPIELGQHHIRTAEFPTGFKTQYQPSILIGKASHQSLADGFPIGKRFKSAPVVRVADNNPVHLGHHARADGRWRLYAFADRDQRALRNWATWLATSPWSPLSFRRPETEVDSVFDVKVIYPQTVSDVDINHVPEVFLPRVGPFKLIDYEKVYATDHEQDIFDQRSINRSLGCVVVVRPDQYVSNVLPLSATQELAAFVGQFMLLRSCL